MPLKILLLSHNFYPFIGGIEGNSEIFAYAFHEQGHEVCLLTWTEDPTGKVFPFEIVRNPNLLQLLRLHAWADVVLENNPCLRLSWPELIFRRPSVVALNTWVARINGNMEVRDKMKHLWLKRAKKVIAASHALRQKTWPNAIVIANPYKDHLFRILPDVSRCNDFVFLGRLVSDKGADLAVEAIYRIKQLIANGSKLSVEPNLTIVGEGPERTNLEAMVSRLGLEQNVFFAGALRGEELVACLNRHRFILIPSVWEEPFGIVALEGVACGCLPIASDGGGLPEAVGKCGAIFRRNDIDDLLATILRILNNPELEQQFRSEAARHLAAHSAKLVAKNYLEVIESAV